MDTRGWKRMAQSIKAELHSGEIEIDSRISSLVRTINSFPDFCTIASYCPNEERNYFLVVFSVMPHNQGWNTFTTLIQSIYAYNNNDDSIMVSPNSFPGGHLYFYLSFEDEESDELALWIRKWFTSNDIKDAWKEQFYETKGKSKSNSNEDSSN